MYLYRTSGLKGVEGERARGPVQCLAHRTRSGRACGLREGTQSKEKVAQVVSLLMFFSNTAIGCETDSEFTEHGRKRILTRQSYYRGQETGGPVRA